MKSIQENTVVIQVEDFLWLWANFGFHVIFRAEICKPLKRLMRKFDFKVLSLHQVIFRRFEEVYDALGNS